MHISGERLVQRSHPQLKNMIQIEQIFPIVIIACTFLSKNNFMKIQIKKLYFLLLFAYSNLKKCEILYHKRMDGKSLD